MQPSATQLPPLSPLYITALWTLVNKPTYFARRRCGKSIRALTNAALEDWRSSYVLVGVTVGVGSLRTQHNGTACCTTQAANLHVLHDVRS